MRLVSLTLGKAKQLKCGDILYHKIIKNSNGNPQSYKVTSRSEISKRYPHEVLINVKRDNLDGYLKIDETQIHKFYFEYGKNTTTICIVIDNKLHSKIKERGKISEVVREALIKYLKEDRSRN